MQKTIKGSVWGGVLFLIAAIGISIGLGYNAAGHHIYYLIIALLLLVGILACVSSFMTAIILDDQGITYKTIGSSKQIPWSDLTKAELDLGTNVYRDVSSQGAHMRAQSYAKLSIWDNKNFITNPLIINMKSFPSRAIPELATFMSGKVDASKLVNLSQYINTQL